MIQAEVGCLDERIASRCGHRMVTIGDSVYIQGGLITNFQVDSTLYIYNYKLKIFKKIPNTSFSANNAVCTLVEYNEVLYAILGYDRKTVQTFDVKTQKWGDMPFNGSPPPIFGHAGTRIGHLVYVNGGVYMEDFQRNLKWLVFDLKNQSVRTMTTMDTSGPVDRIFHTLVTWNGKAYLFGGVGGEIVHYNLFRFEGGEHHNDVWEFDPVWETWKLLEISNRYAPPKRRSHATSVVKDSMFVNAGYDGITEFSDVWEFDLHLHRWKEYRNFGYFPSRRFHSMTSVGDSLYIMGGVTSVKQSMIYMLSDFYRFDIKEKRNMEYTGFEDCIIKTQDDDE